MKERLSPPLEMSRSIGRAFGDAAAWRWRLADDAVGHDVDRADEGRVAFFQLAFFQQRFAFLLAPGNQLRDHRLPEFRGDEDLDDRFSLDAGLRRGELADHGVRGIGAAEIADDFLQVDPFPGGDGIRFLERLAGQVGGDDLVALDQQADGKKNGQEKDQEITAGDPGDLSGQHHFLVHLGPNLPYRRRNCKPSLHGHLRRRSSRSALEKTQPQ